MAKPATITVADGPRLVDLGRVNRLVATRPNNYHLGLSESFTSCTYKSAHVATCDITSLTLVYGNWYGTTSGDGTQTPGPSTLTVRCSVELGNDIIVSGAGRDGAAALTIAPGAAARTAPILAAIPRGTKFFVRTYVQVPSGGQWPIGLHTNVAVRRGVDVVGDGLTVDSGESDNLYSGGADLTAGGAMTGHWNISYSPFLILGTSTSPAAPSVGLAGDSIAADAYDLDGYGLLVRALAGQYGYARVSQPGEHSGQGLPGSVMTARWRALPYLTHVLIHTGANDINTSRPLATVKADMLAMWSAYRYRGIRPSQMTTPPYTSSTDGWTTLANQTVLNSALRLGINQWLRAGAPIKSGAPVAIGTSATTTADIVSADGTITAGSGGHPLAAIVDTGSIPESALDSGKWRVTGIRTVTDAAISNGNTVLTSATAAFTAADVGRAVTVAGAGAAESRLATFIVSINSATVANLNNPASATVTGAGLAVGAATRDGVHPMRDEHTAMAAAIPLLTALGTAWATPTAADASAGTAAANLLTRLAQYRGRYTLSGQQQANDGTDSQDNLIAAHNGGKLPAIRGWDSPNIGGVVATGSTATLAQITTDWNTSKVIPTVSQHWTPNASYDLNPGDTLMDDAASIDACLSSTASTARTRYTAWRQNLGDDLATLQTAGVPVLLRPFHEAGGTFFWWSQEGPTQYVRLWRDLFTYLTTTRGLHNLLWVWSTGPTGLPTSWYPGDDTVDVIAEDRYDIPDGDYSRVFTDLNRFGDPAKIRAMSELGYIPANAAGFARRPFAWSLTWTGIYITESTDAALTRFYADPRVVTRGDAAAFIAGTL